MPELTEKQKFTAFVVCLLLGLTVLLYILICVDHWALVSTAEARVKVIVWNTAIIWIALDYYELRASDIPRIAVCVRQFARAFVKLLVVMVGTYLSAGQHLLHERNNASICLFVVAALAALSIAELLPRFARNRSNNRAHAKHRNRITS